MLRTGMIRLRFTENKHTEVKQMKKIISTILCVSLLATIICVPVSAMEEVVVSESIEEFCEDVNEMVTEYSGSEFVTPDFIEEEQTTVNIDEELKINYCPRLIVQSDKPIDTYNAIDVVSGFFNFYILQFENEKDTNCAYEQYKNNPDIISVEYDISYNAVTLSTEETVNNKALTYSDYENDWYLSSTGIDKVLEKYKDKNLPEIRVAVIDTGVSLNSAYLQDRIIPTGFNTAGDGDENSEQDYEGHGTKVTSVIANCTTPNVKIANYRCVNRFGEIESFTLVCTAILQAIDDGVKAINLSLGAPSDFNLLDEILEFAWSSSCAVFTSSGNYGSDVQFSVGSVLTSSEFMVSVGGSTKYNAPASFANYGKPIDILAPSKDMALLTLNDKISLSSGTSFASPFMVSVYAMYLSVNQTIPFEQRMRAVMNCGSGTDEEYVTNFFGSGIVNPLKLFGLDSLSAPKFSIEPGKYVGEITLGLSSEEGSDIYYTTDYTYPSPTNGFLYTEPITIYDDSAKIRAVAYKDGNKSNYVFGKFCSLVLGTDDMFTVNEKGVLTGYTGNVKYLKIPEVINGITVKEISWNSGFYKAELYGVILPDTVEVLGDTLDRYERPMTLDEQYGAFNENETLDFIIGNGIKTIGYYGVSFLPNLYEVKFPNCEEIMQAGFYQSSFLGAVFPKAKKVGNEAFYNVAKVREIYLPECETIGNDAFSINTYLRIVYAPKADFIDKYDLVDGVFTVDNPESTRNMFYKSSHFSKIDLPQMTSIGNSFFDETPIKNVSLSNVKYIFDLPDTLSGKYCWYSPYYRPVPVELCLPSTLQYCVPATDYKNEFIEYVVYGTKGTYAESWATTNEVQFVELTPETSIAEDIELIWDEYSYKPLEFDVRGFNRTYQWYGSKDEVQGDSDDKAISGATAKTFDPGEDAKYQYYYCKMTSTDIDGSGNTLSTF
ncbi:MAG: hypothetical protein E7530_10225, partial [Ruminococcaceae bacterium]|nr:hypothetical protein [Oscillospiraceae bacterium]